MCLILWRYWFILSWDNHLLRETTSWNSCNISAFVIRSDSLCTWQPLGTNAICQMEPLSGWWMLPSPGPIRPLCHGNCRYDLALQWRNNYHDVVSNYQPHGCSLNRFFRRRSKKTSKLRVTGLCAGNSPKTGEFPAQRASNAENVSIWWRHPANPRLQMIGNNKWDALLNRSKLAPGK